MTIDHRPEVRSSMPDLYHLTVNESDLMLIEAALVTKLEELRQDLNKVQFERASSRMWIEEDAEFLGRSIARLSAVLLQARYLMEHPNEREA